MAHTPFLFLPWPLGARRSVFRLPFFSFCPLFIHRSAISYLIDLLQGPFNRPQKLDVHSWVDKCFVIDDSDVGPLPHHLHSSILPGPRNVDELDHQIPASIAFRDSGGPPNNRGGVLGHRQQRVTRSNFGCLVEGSRLCCAGLLLEKWLACLSFIGKCTAGHYIKGRSPNGLLGLTPRHFLGFGLQRPFQRLLTPALAHLFWTLLLTPFFQTLSMSLVIILRGNLHRVTYPIIDLG